MAAVGTATDGPTNGVVAAATDGVVNGAVDKAVELVSATLDCGCDAAAAVEKAGSGVDDVVMMGTWPVEAEVVAVTGAGVVCSTVF